MVRKVTDTRKKSLQIIWYHHNHSLFIKPVFCSGDKVIVRWMSFRLGFLDFHDSRVNFLYTLRQTACGRWNMLCPLKIIHLCPSKKGYRAKGVEVACFDLYFGSVNSFCSMRRWIGSTVLWTYSHHRAGSRKHDLELVWLFLSLKKMYSCDHKHCLQSFMFDIYGGYYMLKLIRPDRERLIQVINWNMLLHCSFSRPLMTPYGLSLWATKAPTSKVVIIISLSSPLY